MKFLTRAVFGVAELSTEDVALHVARHRVPPFVLETNHWLRANRTLGTDCEQNVIIINECYCACVLVCILKKMGKKQETSVKNKTLTFL